MCSPALLRSGVLRGPGDLKSFMLLHEFDHQDWRNWFNSVGMPSSDAERGTVVDNYEVLVEAAVDGQGIALIAVPLLVDHLEAGRLVPPFGPHLGIDLYYNLLYPKAALARPIVAAFREWLLSLVLMPEPRGDVDQPHSPSRVAHANGAKANGAAGDPLTGRVG
jgi:LysR family glycine cleavage system transcriptional activator